VDFQPQIKKGPNTGYTETSDTPRVTHKRKEEETKLSSKVCRRRKGQKGQKGAYTFLVGKNQAYSRKQERKKTESSKLPVAASDMAKKKEGKKALCENAGCQGGGNQLNQKMMRTNEKCEQDP